MHGTEAISAPYLSDLVLVLGLAVAIQFLFHTLRLPPLIGYLLVGMVIGPHGFQWIEATGQVESLAEIGVILLLFTIGLEFSLERLIRMRRVLLVAGPLQVLLCVGLTLGVGLALGLSWNRALFWGFLLSLSSTAIVMKLLADRSLLESPGGQTALGILIFQDLCIIPMIFFTPFLGLGGEEASPVAGFVWVLGKSLVAVVLVVIGARILIPRLLDQVAHRRSRELFLLTVLLISLGTAWLTSLAGLSLALGAFLAGLVISGSPYSHQVLSDILPFRDSFGSLFFISMGMFWDGRVIWEHPWAIFLLLGGILALKAFSTGISVLVVGYPLRIALISGLFLAQVGEFSFVLSRFGLDAGVFSFQDSQWFLTTSVMTLLLTPFLVGIAPVLADRLTRPLPLLPAPRQPESVDHVIIVGFGINGQNVSRVLQRAGIPYQIIEMNPETVRTFQEQGEPIHYGDATRPEVLHRAGVHQARALVVAISDPLATRTVTAQARSLNHRLYIIVRTRYVREMEALYKDGADDVIPEEYETSIEIFVRLLRRYLVPAHLMEQLVTEIRRHGYAMFRKLHEPESPSAWLDSELPGVEIAGFRVRPGTLFDGKDLGSLQVRPRTGVTILAVRRGGEVYPNPDGAFRFQAGDLLIGLGEREALNRLASLMETPACVGEGSSSANPSHE